MLFSCCGAPALAEDGAISPIPKIDGVSLHLQSTFTPQANFPFPAAFSGEQSLNPEGQAVETATVTGFFGARLWQGGEIYLDPEVFHGFGLRSAAGKGTVGLAGFSNGDAQKGGRWDSDPYVARFFLRQNFGLGGEKEKIKDGLNQVAGERDVSRITVTAGKFAVTDIFDDNTYAHDPRTTFMNWAIWEAGAFDYAADVKGYNYGAAVEWNEKDRTLRGGFFSVPVRPNALQLDSDIGQRGFAVVEFEDRYSLSKQPGKLRLTAWENTAFAGDYSGAVQLLAVSPDINANIALTRKNRTEYGFIANLEQAVTADLGVFARLSWNDGRVEKDSFTDIDASLSAGMSLKGSGWGRPGDTFGLAGALNSISPSHQRFFEAGGLGLLIGDGRLSYDGERILEAYYAIGVSKALTLTLDYQFIGNPAYNSARGPVSVLGGRVHVEF